MENLSKVVQEPPKARDMSIPRDVGYVQHAVLREMLALPKAAQREVMHAVTGIETAKDDERREAVSLLKKGKSLSSVNEFLRLRKDGLVRLVGDESDPGIDESNRELIGAQSSAIRHRDHERYADRR